MPEITELNAAINTIGDALASARNAVVFTGAGISTESGIPDFRSPGGIWERQNPVMFDDFLASREARREDWRRRFTMLDQFGDAIPNAGHLAIAEQMRRGIVSAVITQNIDGLHQRAGTPADKVIEIHGNGTFATCLDCETRYELADIRPVVEGEGRDFLCAQCGGLVKAAVISFGQAMPVDEMRRAEEAARQADLFIAVGSSLVVYPAAGLPVIAKKHGARLIIINRDPTDIDPLADHVIHFQIGEVFAPFVGD